MGKTKTLVLEIDFHYTNQTDCKSNVLYGVIYNK